MEISNLKANAKDEDVFKKSNIFKIIKGSVIAIVFSFIALTIYAAVLSFTSISESTMVPVIIVITGISVLIGSSISAMHIKNRGIINGGVVGLIYMLLIYILSSVFLVNFSININSIIMIIVALLTGMIGGIIGVNMSAK